jgi:hypothetical protein
VVLVQSITCFQLPSVKLGPSHYGAKISPVQALNPNQSPSVLVCSSERGRSKENKICPDRTTNNGFRWVTAFPAFDTLHALVACGSFCLIFLSVLVLSANEQAWQLRGATGGERVRDSA